MTPVTACGSQLSLIVAPPDVIYPDISLRDTTGLPGILILRPRATIDTVAFRAVNTAYICPETLGGGDPPSIISLALGKRISPSGSQLEIFHTDCNNTYTVHTYIYIYMVRFFHDTFRLFYYSMSRGGGRGEGNEFVLEVLDSYYTYGLWNRNAHEQRVTAGLLFCLRSMRVMEGKFHDVIEK